MVNQLTQNSLEVTQIFTFGITEFVILCNLSIAFALEPDKISTLIQMSSQNFTVGYHTLHVVLTVCQYIVFIIQL